MNLSHFHVFGCTCYILNDREQVGKFQAKSDQCVFLGYSTNSRAYKVYNLRTKTIMKTINVVIDDFNELAWVSEEDKSVSLIENVENQMQKDNVTPAVTTQLLLDIATTFETKLAITTTVAIEPKIDIFNITDLVMRDPLTRIQKNHPIGNIIGDLTKGIRIRNRSRINYQDMVRYVCYTSSFEPKNVKEALLDEYWVKVMQEELE